MDILNHGDEGEAILIGNWGYNGDTKDYTHAPTVGKRFRAFAKTPHEVEIDGERYELRFVLTDAKGKKEKTKVYQMSKKLIREPA